MAAAQTPIRSSTAATWGNKNASNAIDKSPMRLVLAKKKEAQVVTARATVIENIRYAFGKRQRFADGGYETGRI
jgi:hypothetical protein